MEREKSTLFLTFGVSMLCHLIFFGLMLFWPSRSPAIRFKAPSAIHVDMVSLPTPDVQPAGEPVTRPEPVETPLPEPETVKIPQPDEMKPEIPIKIPEKTEPEVKIKEPEKISPKLPKHIKAKVKPKPDKLPAKIISLVPEKKKPKPDLKPKKIKKPQKRPSSDIKKAIAKLETSKRKISYDSVKAKIENLRKKHGNIIKEKGLAKGKGGTSGGPSRGKFSPALAGQLNIYKYGPLRDRITQNWAFNPSLAGGGADLEVQLLVKIMANGKISSIKHVKRSGNTLLDESAFRAIKKSDPLPRLPKGLPYYEIIMGFGPSGLN